LVHCIQTAEDIVKLLSRPGNPIILVSWTRAPVANSKEEPLQPVFLSRVIMPMHEERDIVVTNSVCLSVCPMPVLCVNEWIYRHIFWHSGRGVILLFGHTAVTEFQEKPPQRGALNVYGVGKFCKSFWLSRKRYKIDP